MAFEVTVVAVAIAIGGILMGHFEERTPKWRKILKLLVAMGVAQFVSTTFGPVWFYVLFGALLAVVLAVHVWWLPKHGINGWTGEPKDKYYELRGWKR